MPTIPQLKQQKQQAFQQADQNGDAITPQQWGHVVGLMQSALQKADPQQNPQTAQIVQQLSQMLVDSKPMPFQVMDQVREQLASLDEPAAQDMVTLIDDALESMGKINPNLKDVIPASQQLRVREGLAKFLQAALSYKQLSGTDMLSAVQMAIKQQGMGMLPPEDRAIIQNMVMTGDTSKFTQLLSHDVGGENGAPQGLVDQRIG